MLSGIIGTLVSCLIGWLFIEKIPGWLGLRGAIATLCKVIGVLIIISALLSWIC